MSEAADTLVTVATGVNEAEAEWLAAMLRHAGIEAFNATVGYVRMVPWEGIALSQPYRVQARGSDAVRAMELVAELRAEAARHVDEIDWDRVDVGEPENEIIGRGDGLTAEVDSDRVSPERSEITARRADREDHEAQHSMRAAWKWLGVWSLLTVVGMLLYQPLKRELGVLTESAAADGLMRSLAEVVPVAGVVVPAGVSLFSLIVMIGLAVRTKSLEHAAPSKVEGDRAAARRTRMRAAKITVFWLLMPQLALLVVVILTWIVGVGIEAFGPTVYVERPDENVEKQLDLLRAFGMSPVEFGERPKFRALDMTAPVFFVGGWLASLASFIGCGVGLVMHALAGLRRGRVSAAEE